MSTSSLRLIINWIVGVLFGTSLIAATSPWFVRSYLPQFVDPVRRVAIAQPGSSYRWRSEGYATTKIGPIGMPGRTTSPGDQAETIRVALWGDSQAEGVCVPDSKKLFVHIERMAAGADRSMACLPLARSGDDAGHWLTQIPGVEREWAIDLHVMMVADLPDLLAANRAPRKPAEDLEAESEIASLLPAFAIQAARNLVTAEDGTPRRLRWRIGPVSSPHWQNASITPADRNDPDDRAIWREAMRIIRQSSDRPIVILYAPKSPSIQGGRIVLQDPSASQFQLMAEAAEAVGLAVVDSSAVLRQAALLDQWPHGFHNGQFGSGHLNATGNQAVAGELLPAIIEIVDEKD